MKVVLIVSPNFPPINAPDMQRVRISLPYFTEYGWKPVVLTVDPTYVEGVKEPFLLETIPPEVHVRRVRALPAHWTRKIGIGNLGLRAISFLYPAGADVIKKYHVDLVYFSTTMFPTMALGRIWKTHLGVPFVLDIQDPWLSDYYDRKPKSEKPPKYWFAQHLHRILEPWTMKEVDGIIAVSRDYISSLQRRYSWIADKPNCTIPFGASETDFHFTRAIAQKNRFFQPDGRKLNGVYVGRGGADMMHSLRIIFGALREGLQKNAELFSKVQLYFIGTDYASDDRAKKTVEPVADEFGIRGHVHEYPYRIPYFEALQLLSDSNFLIVPGSDDPQYTASKIYPYILAQKPILAVFHERSSVVEVIHKTRAGVVIPFTQAKPIEWYVQQLLPIWEELLKALPFKPETDWVQFTPYTAREMTRFQCEVFDRVVEIWKKEM